MLRLLSYSLLLLLPATVVGQSCDTMIWPIQAPVEYINSYDLYGVKTYFFNAAKKQPQNKEVIRKMRQQYDSVATVTIGKVILREVPNNADETYADQWFWWLVKEPKKTYLNCFILSVALKGAPRKSYYELQFRDDSTIYKWVEPRNSTYNFSDVFLLLDGVMQVSDENNNQNKRLVAADSIIKHKALTAPLKVLTKYNGYASEDDASKIQYYKSLQFIFTKEEGEKLLSILNCMQHDTGLKKQQPEN